MIEPRQSMGMYVRLGEIKSEDEEGLERDSDHIGPDIRVQLQFRKFERRNMFLEFITRPREYFIKCKAELVSFTEFVGTHVRYGNELFNSIYSSNYNSLHRLIEVGKMERIVYPAGSVLPYT